MDSPRKPLGQQRKAPRFNPTILYGRANRFRSGRGRYGRGRFCQTEPEIINLEKAQSELQALQKHHRQRWIQHHLYLRKTAVWEENVQQSTKSLRLSRLSRLSRPGWEYNHNNSWTKPERNTNASTCPDGRQPGVSSNTNARRAIHEPTIHSKLRVSGQGQAGRMGQRGLSGLRWSILSLCSWSILFNIIWLNLRFFLFSTFL